MRLLTQATFGATDADVNSVMTLGDDAWIEAQIKLPPTSYQAYWDELDAQVQKVTPGKTSRTQVYYSFWRGAITGEDQLRQRVAYALSQMFVVSMVDGGVGNNPRGAANYLDTLSKNAFGNYRQLIEAVALHPMMGLYLSHLRNRKENPYTGRVPDENFAREVMQLFSIGLYELKPDGTVRTGADGLPLETYDNDDIAGMAKVFTGWSWSCADTSDTCFTRVTEGGVEDPNRVVLPMQAYAQFHSTAQKDFLGVTIASQDAPDPRASLKVALDTLYNHPNVGPFVGKQLIQRLVTSNPSPAYIGRVAAAFADNGAGVRGDMKAVIKAVLLDPEARQVPSGDAGLVYGKLREPVLRLSAILRAFGGTSSSGQWRIGNTDDPGWSIGQTPLRSPSVFNFYRPGYVPPVTQAGNMGLTVPEMQITHEASVAGYANIIRDLLTNGMDDDLTAKTRDIKVNVDALSQQARDADVLVGLVDDRLFGGLMPAELKALIVTAVNSIFVPDVKASTPARVQELLTNRTLLAIYLAVVSPEFIVQK